LFHKITSFFCFIIKSKNEHGVHSPFVFDLITSCFYKKKDKNDLTIFLNYKKKLSRNSSLLEISNFNFISNLLFSNKRKRSRIIENLGISNGRAGLLINIIQYLKPKSILEIGTSLGIVTVALSSAQESSKITTLDENEKTVNIIREMFKKNTFKNVKFLAGNFDITLPQALNNSDFIYFKGKNINETTLKYFEFSLTYIHNDSVILFENIHSDKESEKIWNHIKDNKKVTVTIDTFFWGFVFFRKEQEKEHFIIRI
jgi:predicted O-methyltransferase YrrM